MCGREQAGAGADPRELISDPYARSRAERAVEEPPEGLAVCDLDGRWDHHEHDPSEYASDREMEERFERRFER